jgi:hypothetical protein
MNQQRLAATADRAGSEKTGRLLQRPLKNFGCWQQRWPNLEVPTQDEIKLIAELCDLSTEAASVAAHQGCHSLLAAATIRQ